LAEVIYTVTVRGEVPADIVERVSQAHARALNGAPCPDERRGVSDRRNRAKGPPKRQGQSQVEPAVEEGAA
jgi:hypothetical protein